MPKLVKRLLLSAGILLAMHSINADTLSSTISVVINVPGACTFNITNLTISYSPIDNAPVNTTNTISIRCNPGTIYNVGLNAGTTPGATIYSRAASSGNHTINYGLYQDAAHSMIWGNTIGTNTVAGTANGTTQNYIIYGQVFAGQMAPIGTYTDTVTLTVTF